MNTSCYHTEPAGLARPVKAADGASIDHTSATVDELLCAVVLSALENGAPDQAVVLRVAVPGQPLPVDAAVAAACLLQPQTGDLVLLCRLPQTVAETAASAWWVLSVLRRGQPAALATLAVPGAAGLKLQAEALHLVAQHVDIDAVQTTVNANVFRLVASAAHVVAQRLTQVVRVFHSTADTVTEHCRTRVAVVEELDSTQAGIEVLESKQAMTIKGGHVLVDAQETVRMDGRHILMG